MVRPPDAWQRLVNVHQFLQCSQRQNGGFRTWCRGEVGASNWDKAELTGEDLDLAVTHVAGQVGDAYQPEFSAVERMGGVCDRDAALATMSAEGRIALVGVFRRG
jgi:hypothetical protein